MQSATIAFVSVGKICIGEKAGLANAEQYDAEYITKRVPNFEKQSRQFFLIMWREALYKKGCLPKTT